MLVKPSQPEIDDDFMRVLDSLCFSERLCRDNGYQELSKCFDKLGHMFEIGVFEIDDIEGIIPTSITANDYRDAATKILTLQPGHDLGYAYLRIAKRILDPIEAAKGGEVEPETDKEFTQELVDQDAKEYHLESNPWDVRDQREWARFWLDHGEDAAAIQYLTKAVRGERMLNR